MDNKKYSIQLLSWPAIILFIVFFAAKIFDKIDWSWIWIFSPLWVPLALAFVLMLLIIIGIIITSMFRKW